MSDKASKNDLAQVLSYFEIGEIGKEEPGSEAVGIRVESGFCLDAEVVDLRGKVDWFQEETGVEWRELTGLSTQAIMDVRRKTAIRAKQLESERKKKDPIQQKIGKLHELNRLRDRVVELAEQIAVVQGEATDRIFRKYGLEPSDFD